MVRWEPLLVFAQGSATLLGVLVKSNATELLYQFTIWLKTHFTNYKYHNMDIVDLKYMDIVVYSRSGCVIRNENVIRLT